MTERTKAEKLEWAPWDERRRWILHSEFSNLRSALETADFPALARKLLEVQGERISMTLGLGRSYAHAFGLAQTAVNRFAREKGDRP
jgi:hypothetical protein